jgi:N-acetylmuramoyl-L-alanine amidase
VSQGVIDMRDEGRPRPGRLEVQRPKRKSIAPRPPEPPDQGQAISETVIRLRTLARSLATIFLASVVVATLFTWLTPNSFLPAASADQLAVALATQSGPGDEPLPALPTLTTMPTQVPLNRVGIVSGHRGLHRRTGQPDPGAVCADGLTEREVNEAIATQVVELLRPYGYQVDLLDEFDARLEGYEALALVSIHADSCEYINELATGFKVAGFAETRVPEQDAQLVSCLVSHYAETTGLPFHPSVTFDMSLYHTFQEIAPSTPGAIIEVGFLYLDRAFLTEHADVAALGIARGVMCYLRGEAPGGGPTVTPSVTPTRLP